MNGFLELELAEFEWSMEHSTDNQCQTHGKLNSVTVLYIKNIYMYICDHLLQQVLEMSSFNYQTCLILKEMKHWGTLFYITYNFHMISFHSEGPLYWIVLDTHEKKNTLHCTWHVCYRQQTKLDWVTKMIHCIVHMLTDWQFVSRAVAVKTATHCGQFLDKNLKQYLVICPPIVKYVWGMKDVNSNSWSNLQ